MKMQGSKYPTSIRGDAKKIELTTLWRPPQCGWIPVQPRQTHLRETALGRALTSTKPSSRPYQGLIPGVSPDR